MPAYLSVAAWRATATTLGVLALALTILRVWHRFRKRHLWWDDHWAIISQTFNLIYCTSVWFRDDDRSPRYSMEHRVRVHWVGTLSFHLVVWSARISIAMSIARIVPPKTKMRRFLYILSAFFGLACATFIFQRVWMCTHRASWDYNVTAVCFLGNALGILSLCTDIPADACLVVIPLHMLWRVKLPRKQRYLILTIFAASVLSSVVGIIYAVFSFQAQKRQPTWTRLTALVGNIKATTTLLVCNLLVVATYVYSLLSKDEEQEISEPSETRSKMTVPPPTTFVHLTVISSPEVTNDCAFSGFYISATRTRPMISDSPPDRTAPPIDTFSLKDGP